jgi:hypothetical protein
MARPQTRPSIAFVITYFGRAPMWLPAFLLSCARNPDVDWLLYTDIDTGPRVPANVIVRPTTVAELNERCTQALDTRIEIRSRNICDLKSAYGIIFEDDLRPYEFWAHTDLDIVWGSVRDFATDDILNGHDVFSSRPNKLAGHCTLFRNTPENNRLFELIPDVRPLMASPRCEHLDETELTRNLRRHLDAIRPRNTPRVYWERELSTNADYQRAMGDGPSDAIWWKDGHTFGVKGEELMYVHFHKLKQHMTTINFGPEDTPAAFRITRQGFFV